MDRKPAIYLASASPRRHALLNQIGVRHEQLLVDIEEIHRSGETAEHYVQRLALEKARAGQDSLGGAAARPVLGADTAVVADGQIMGKPRDRQHGIEMLQCLSGKRHLVLSAVALVADQVAVRVNRSSVTFRTVSAGECSAYWDTGEPFDKAGAYAIQGMAAMFISRLEGSYSGVMGLPLFETAELLREAGIELF